MPLNLLVQSHRVVIPVLVRGVRLTRLLMSPGINVTEVMTGTERVIIHAIATLCKQLKSITKS